MEVRDASISLPDRYRVIRRIATGGMATVWAAEDGVLGREVAVKVLAPHVAADAVARARFEREARTAARVGDHPNIVTIYDIGEHGSSAFIVMELYRGGTIAERLREAEVMPRKQALAWLSEAAAGLDYAHGRDVVHRDVKPANLLLDERGRLGVADFGIARLADETSLTQAGTVLGTAAYLSPEQATGESATAASDRYSLGCVAFEMLTGRRPFAGEHAAAQARQHVEAPMPATGITQAVDEVLGRMLSKAPDERYPTCALFVEELRHAVATAPSARREPPTQPTRRVAAPAPVPEPTPRSRRLEPAAAAPPPAPGRERGGRGWVALAGLAAILLAVALVALLSGGDDGGDRTAVDEPRSTPREEARPRQTTPATPPPAEEQPPDGEPEAGPGPGAEEESPAALNDQGFALLQAGNAEEAIPLLERSVEGYEQQGDAANPTTYGYALYNLAEAYAAVGRYAEAIPYYERRLQVSPDDRPELVQERLDRARELAGQGGGEGGGEKPGKGPKDKDD